MLEVAALVASAGASEDVICAALLHDAIEDQKKTRAEIESLFGAAVAGMVWEVTDDKTLDKKERQKLQIEHAPHLSPGAKLIKLSGNFVVFGRTKFAQHNILMLRFIYSSLTPPPALMGGLGLPCARKPSKNSVSPPT